MRLDLLLLGMGPDGHTASLFPGTDALDERERLFTANRVPQLDTWRITATLPLINASRRVVFLVQGVTKRGRCGSRCIRPTARLPCPPRSSRRTTAH